MTQQKQGPKKYHVVVRRESMVRARAEAHGQTITIAIKGGDPTRGLTAPETLLAAFGACILSNVNKKAAALGVQIDDARIEFTGMRHPNPLGIEALEYQLILTSAEAADKLQMVYDHAVSIGTATSAILHGLTPHGELRIETPMSENGRA